VSDVGEDDGVDVPQPLAATIITPIMICLRFIVISIIASEGCWTGRYLMLPSGR